MTALQILTEARELIAPIHRWCQLAMAKTGHDKPCAPGSRYAQKFCAIGALYKIAGYGGARTSATVFLWHATREMRGGMVGGPQFVNDDTSVDPFKAHANVLALYDRAIELAKIEEAK